MTVKIDKKIVRYNVVKPDEPAATPASVAAPVVQQMHENVARPETLSGATYKVKTPLSDQAKKLERITFHAHGSRQALG